ncbi:MAG: hypothetical protein COA78_26710 [Blastopirellula sp.]|nr:MAG: hypothetical protein COA78_26710 [Blastopirellula sp.]
MNGKHIRLGFAIILTALHFGISLVIAELGREFQSVNNEFIIFMILAVSLVQSSLLATWAVLGKGPYWLRIPVSFLLLVWSAFCLFQLIEYGSVDELIVSLSIMMFLQFFIITALVIFIQIVLKLLKMESHLDTTTRFSMGTLMIVTTLIAVTIGIGKVLVQQVMDLSWETYNSLDEEFWIYPFLSIFNALTAVLLLVALWCKRWPFKLILLLPISLLIAAMSGVESVLFAYFFNDSTDWYIFAWINYGQAFFFYATMFPLWRWADQVESEEEEDETKPQTGSLSQWVDAFKNIEQQIEQSKGYLLPIRFVCAGCVVIAHLITIIILFAIDIDINSGPDVIILGYPTSLIGILATFSVFPKKWFWVRIGLSSLLIVPVWLLTMHVLYERFTNGDAAGWAAMIFLQFFLLVVILGSIKLSFQLIGPDKNSNDSRFSLGFLIIGVTCTAMLFGGARLFLQITGWGVDVFQWEYFFLCVVLGIYLAIGSVIALAGLYPKSVSRKLGASALALVGAWLCGVCCYYTLTLVFGETGGITLLDMFFLFEAQAIFLMLTVLPFWRWETPLIQFDGIQEIQEEPDPLPPSPEASSPF